MAKCVLRAFLLIWMSPAQRRSGYALRNAPQHPFATPQAALGSATPATQPPAHAALMRHASHTAASVPPQPRLPDHLSAPFSACRASGDAFAMGPGADELAFNSTFEDHVAGVLQTLLGWDGSGECHTEGMHMMDMQSDARYADPSNGRARCRSARLQ